MRAFFEPSYESGRPVRWRIERRDGEPFTVAALWDTWKPRDSPEPDTRLHSFSMLTMNADGHPLMGRFHAPGSDKRSLVVVPADLREAWLRTEDLGAFLREIPTDEFTSQADPLPPRKKATEPVLSEQRTEPVLSEQQRLDLMGLQSGRR